VSTTRDHEPVWSDVRLADPHGQTDKAARVRAMFDAIAPTYELVNSVLSLGRDASWRRRAVKMARIEPRDRVLDLACGTGDFARAFVAASPASIVGSDFSRQMLALAAARPPESIRWLCGDALALPFADGAFDVVSCAFGVRNFQDCHAGFREMHRVLSDRGRAVILEFAMPKGRVLGRLYLAYLRSVLPRLATWISGDRSGAYRYLPSSVMAFWTEQQVVESLASAGFARVEQQAFTCGAVRTYVAWKQGP